MSFLIVIPPWKCFQPRKGQLLQAIASQFAPELGSRMTPNWWCNGDRIEPNIWLSANHLYQTKTELTLAHLSMRCNKNRKLEGKSKQLSGVTYWAASQFQLLWYEAVARGVSTENLSVHGTSGRRSLPIDTLIFISSKWLTRFLLLGSSFTSFPKYMALTSKR